MADEALRILVNETSRIERGQHRHAPVHHLTTERLHVFLSLLFQHVGLALELDVW